MSEDLSNKIYKILDKKQLSISGISRELKAEGFEEHRLIITGYLRALRDMDKLTEVEIPPSKVYVCVESEDASESELYSVMSKHFQSLEPDIRFPVAVHIATSIFERPVFKGELKLMGINESHIRNYRRSLITVTDLASKDLKELRRSINRIVIPDSDPAYNIAVDSTSAEILLIANTVLIALVKEMSDLSGLVPKTKQVTLT
ncbi:hypothetical protein HNV12_24405 [Methanococcoides sp. SA1]|nr:hypothetical protein [Methanococcoides sp. SA1]NPE31039.1 hypothetical protein [Methanococcoides sp. SA1]